MAGIFTVATFNFFAISIHYISIVLTPTVPLYTHANFTNKDHDSDCAIDPHNLCNQVCTS